MNFDHHNNGHGDSDILEPDIRAQEEALALLLENVMNVPLAPLRSTLNDLHKRLDAVERANTNTLRSTEMVLADEIRAGARKVNGRLGDINNVILALQDELDTLSAAFKRHDASCRDSFLVAAHSIESLRSELVSLREQGQVGTSSLQRQQAELSQRIDALMSALDPRFAGLTATIEAQEAVVIRSMHEQLALQLRPLFVQGKWLLMLCGLSLASSVGVIALMLMR